MVQFIETLRLLAMEPTRYLSIQDCANLERVSHSASDIAWLCYPVVADLSAFGITDQMTHNAFSDLPRHCTAFFRRFDCNKLTSLRVPWNPQTIVITNGISYSDAGMLLDKCPNLVELPPIEARYEKPMDVLFRTEKRSLQSITLYCDVSNYEEEMLWSCDIPETRVSSTSVGRLEIAVKIPFNCDYAIDSGLGAFIRLFVNRRFDILAVKSLKVFVASNFKFEDRRAYNCPIARQTSMKFPGIFQGWTSLEELSITIEHATSYIVLNGLPELHLDPFSSLRTFSIVPLHCASVPASELLCRSEFYINDATMGCMPALRHLNIGSCSSNYLIHDVYKDSHSLKARKEILERTILILNESKVQGVHIGRLSKEVATPEILARIGESGCLRQFGMVEMPVSTDTLLNILKRNKDLEFISVVHSDEIGDELFTLLAKAQLRKVSRIFNLSCSPAGIRRYIKWRIRQIENGRALSEVELRNGCVNADITTVCRINNMNPKEVLKKGRISLHWNGE